MKDCEATLPQDQARPSSVPWRQETPQWKYLGTSTHRLIQIVLRNYLGVASKAIMISFDHHFSTYPVDGHYLSVNKTFVMKEILQENGILSQDTQMFMHLVLRAKIWQFENYWSACPDDLLNKHCPQLQKFWFIRSRWAWKICISDKFPRTADVLSALGHTLTTKLYMEVCWLHRAGHIQYQRGGPVSSVLAEGSSQHWYRE